jgi:prepilin peptidase CpaA
MLTTVALCLYVIALVGAALSDLTRYEIPNVLSLTPAIAFALIAPALPVWTTLGHLGAAVAMFALGAAFFVLNIWGGGDVKLLAATTLWVGWQELPSFLLTVALLGAAIAILLLIARAIAGRDFRRGRWYSRLLAKSSGVPYGVAIATAALLLLFPGDAPAPLVQLALN